MGFTQSDLLDSFGPASTVFRDLGDMKAAASGTVYDLTVGAPDGFPEQEIIEELNKGLKDSVNHSYGGINGSIILREAVAKWYEEQYGVHLDPGTEILPVVGSKRAMIDIALNIVNKGRKVLLPNVCYPTYRVATKIARAVEAEYKIEPENGFLPVFEDIDAAGADLMYMNYPNNPTGAVGTLKTFEESIEMANKNDFLICHDNAYSEIVFDDVKPLSFLQAEGAKQVGIEVFSFSKVFNMAGWRIGCIVGNADMIKIYRKSLVDYTSGVFTPIQLAAAKALEIFKEHKVGEKQSKKYQDRRDLVFPELQKRGWECILPKGAMYIWSKLPVKDSMEFTKKLLANYGVFVTPGEAYGPDCKEWVRIGLVYPENKLSEMVSRIPPVGDKIYDC